MKTPEILVAVAQVAAGGTIVQGVMAFLRRRSELAKLDRQTDSVAVETADRLLLMLRGELDSAKAEIIASAREHKDERVDLRRQIVILGEAVSQLRADLVVAQTEIARLKTDRHT